MDNLIMKILYKSISHLILVALAVCVVSAVWGGQRTRILQEVVDDSQQLQRLNGMPVVISKKNVTVLISPHDIMLGNDKIIYFRLVISNPTDDTLDFSMDNIEIVANKTSLHLLTLDEMLAKERAFYSTEEYQISSDQEKTLTPFVEAKMAQVRQKVLKSEAVAPGDKMGGNVAVDVPFGTEQFSFLVRIAGEVHRFDFNVGEF